MKDRYPSAAVLLFNSEPPDIEDKLCFELNPFDEEDREQAYREVLIIIDTAGAFQERADAADEQSERYERTVCLLAEGMALKAWVSLNDSHPQLRLTFTLLAIPCSVIGLLILSRTAAGVIYTDIQSLLDKHDVVQ